MQVCRADAIRHLIAGHEPKAGRLAQVCAALGLEFYVGPPRIGANVSDINSLPHTSLRALEASAQTLKPNRGGSRAQSGAR